MSVSTVRSRFSLTRETLRFGDVGGLDEVKEEIRMKIIVPFQRPELFRKYGKRVGGREM